MRTAYIVHDGQTTNKPFSFITDIKDLKEQDFVVVDTRFGLKTGKVVEIRETEDPTATRMVVCKIDINKFNKKKEKFEHRKDLIDEIDSIVKHTPPMKIYELLAKEDPTLAKLVKELKGEK